MSDSEDAIDRSELHGEMENIWTTTVEALS
jgi:hypothetical protein